MDMKASNVEHEKEQRRWQRVGMNSERTRAVESVVSAQGTPAREEKKRGRESVPQSQAGGHHHLGPEEEPPYVREEGENLTSKGATRPVRAEMGNGHVSV